MSEKQRILDLYCGTKSMSKSFTDFECITIDCESKFKPTWVLDILKPFDVFWASPPCTAFSVASIGRHWDTEGKPKSKTANDGLEILDRTIGLIAVLKPKYWYIENPRGMMRKVINPLFRKWRVTKYKRNTVTYCQYGEQYMKPTDIWTNNVSWIPRKACKNGDSCHEKQPRGYKAKKAFDCLGKGVKD